HVPLTEATAGLIGARELALLRPGAFLVNAARGGVVDEQALYEALAARRLAGAALDVFEQEPLPADHPLRSLDNVVLTPHLGAATREAQQNVAVEIAEAVRAALVEGDLSHALNAPAIGGEEMRRLRPLLDLAGRLGRMAAALAGGPIRRVEVRYGGAAEKPLQPLTAAALIGLLADAVGPGAVDFVNAPHLAAARGIDVKRIGLGSYGPYAEYIGLRLESASRETRVAGALLAKGYPRVVRIDDYYVDFV